MNGYCNANEIDQFTCYTPRGQSVVDYLLCSGKMFSNLRTFYIGCKLAESDHAPLHFCKNVALKYFCAGTTDTKFGLNF